MINQKQKTVAQEVRCAGKTLHSGEDVLMRIMPAPADAGISFIRTDIPGSAPIAASYENVVDTVLCTSIANSSGVAVATVEHMMAALAGLGIDNATIMINGHEVPIMDGSSQPFVFLLECAGTKELDADRRYIRLNKTIRVESGDSWIELEPSNGMSMEMSIDFGHAVVGHQSAEVDFGVTSFKNSLCRARTFGFEEDVEKLRAAGLARGGSLENAVVVGQNAILNEGGLRYNDEFIRHKMLDCLGDLALAGHPVLAHVRGHKMGHALNNRVLRELFADRSNWEYVTAAEMAVIQANAIHKTTAAVATI